MTTADDRMRRGMEMLERLTGEPPKSDDMPEYELVPGMSDWVTASLFGDVWGRPTLETKIRSIATMSALTVLGREPQVKFHVEYALNLGWTKEEIAELFFHLAFYGGLPAALNALSVAREVFEEKGLLSSKKVYKEVGMSTTEERLQRGEEVMRELSAGTRKAAGLPEYEIAPDMGDWVTASLFGDVWGRPTLEKKIRSVATMSALTVLGRERQLKSHVNFALNLGWTKEEIAELFFHLAFYGGLPAALNALGVAQQVFEERGLLK